MKPSTLAEIYKQAMINGRAMTSWRFRDTDSLLDYLTSEPYQWAWHCDTPVKIKGVCLEQVGCVPREFDCKKRHYVLLSSEEEIKKLKRIPYLEALKQIRESYKKCGCL